MAKRTIIRRHPVIVYYLLAFVLSWTGILLVVGGLGNVPGTAAEVDRLFPAVYLAMLVGPSVGGLATVALVGGPDGLAELWSRVARWRVGGKWWGVALLAAPIVVLTTALGLSLVSPAFAPGLFGSEDRMSLVLFGLVVGLGAGAFEELGWTGVATPSLLTRFGALQTGLMVGVPWGLWHLLATYWGIEDSAGSIPLALFLPAMLLSFLPTFRVLMVWVYGHTGSLLVAMVMHASLTSSLLIFQPLGLSGAGILTWNVTLALVIWLVYSGARVFVAPPGAGAGPSHQLASP